MMTFLSLLQKIMRQTELEKSDLQNVRKTGMSVIYEPRGKAREYSSLAVNLYTGCGH